MKDLLPLSRKNSGLCSSCTRCACRFRQALLTYAKCLPVFAPAFGATTGCLLWFSPVGKVFAADCCESCKVVKQGRGEACHLQKTLSKRVG